MGHTNTNLPFTTTLHLSTDSDLEAFSRNPPEDSFEAIHVQTTTITNFLNEVFLSY